MNIYEVKLIGEESDVPAIVKSYNTVIIAKNGGLFLLKDISAFFDWELCIIFPDAEKAKYFLRHFRHGMHDYREGMIKGDYVWHIVHFKYPKEDTLYADQIRMSTEYVQFDLENAETW